MSSNLAVGRAKAGITRLDTLERQDSGLRMGIDADESRQWTVRGLGFESPRLHYLQIMTSGKTDVIAVERLYVSDTKIPILLGKTSVYCASVFIRWTCVYYGATVRNGACLLACHTSCLGSNPNSSIAGWTGDSSSWVS